MSLSSLDDLIRELPKDESGNESGTVNPSEYDPYTHVLNLLRDTVKAVDEQKA